MGNNYNCYKVIEHQNVFKAGASNEKLLRSKKKKTLLSLVHHWSLVLYLQCFNPESIIMMRFTWLDSERQNVKKCVQVINVRKQQIQHCQSQLHVVNTAIYKHCILLNKTGQVYQTESWAFVCKQSWAPPAEKLKTFITVFHFTTLMDLLICRNNRRLSVKYVFKSEWTVRFKIQSASLKLFNNIHTS